MYHVSDNVIELDTGKGFCKILLELNKVRKHWVEIRKGSKVMIGTFEFYIWQKRGPANALGRVRVPGNVK